VQKWIVRLAGGAASGAAATVAMTGWMLATAPRDPGFELPPHRIVRRAAQRLGIPVRPADPKLIPATTVAHFAFGSAGGAGYALLRRRPSLPSALAYATGIWASSYAGWAPALRLIPPPQRDDRHRQVLTFTAHLVYGAALGLATRRLLGGDAARGRPSEDATRRQPDENAVGIVAPAIGSPT
jgi:hypothetical protein